MARIILAANSIWNIRNFRSGLVRALLERGHEVATVAPGRVGVEIDGTEVRHRSWPVDRSGTNPIRDVACIGRLAWIVREERPDVFFSFTVKPNIYGCLVCSILKVPAVPNVSGLGTAFLGHSAFRRAIVLMYRVAFRAAAAVFFQNPDDLHLFVRDRIVRARQAQLLPGSGVDLDHFTPAGLPPELHFLMIARLLGDKGVREYVEAARTLRRELPNATFALMGDLDIQNRSAITASELDGWATEGVIEYLGSAADVRPSIARSAAVVLPSYREGLPRTLLEAAAMGRPLIATDVPGCREVAREGVTGFLCKEKDPSSLAAAMRRLASTAYEERVAMGARARAMAEGEFDETIVLRAYLDAVERLSV